MQQRFLASTGFLCFISWVWLALVSGLPDFALAAENTNPRLDMVMLTGAETGTYQRFGEDIARVTAPSNIIVNLAASHGSIDTIKRLQLANDNPHHADMGIVQSDLLTYLQRSHKPAMKQLAAGIRIVFPLYQEEVHVLARRSIADMTQLNHKRLIVGPEGSGHWLTAMNLLHMLDIKPASIQRMNMEEAALAVLRNRADAMLFVGGKPIQLFSNIALLGSEAGEAYGQLIQEVHFLPLTDTRLLKDYRAARISPEDYPFVSQVVPTVAVQALLVSYQPHDRAATSTKATSASSAQAYCQALGGIGLSLRANESYLQQYGHPKWREVKLEDRQVKGWKTEPCVDAFRNAASTVEDPMEQELLDSVKNRWNM